MTSLSTLWSSSVSWSSLYGSARSLRPSSDAIVLASSLFIRPASTPRRVLQPLHGSAAPHASRHHSRAEFGSGMTPYSPNQADASTITIGVLRGALRDVTNNVAPPVGQGHLVSNLRVLKAEYVAGSGGIRR